LFSASYSSPRTRSIQSYCPIHCSLNLHAIVEWWFEIQLVQSSNYASSVWFSDIASNWYPPLTTNRRYEFSDWMVRIGAKNSFLSIPRWWKYKSRSNTSRTW
jgi:hypothetical protein